MSAFVILHYTEINPVKVIGTFDTDAEARDHAEREGYSDDGDAYEVHQIQDINKEKAMKFYAMLDDNTCVAVEGETWTDAADNEPQNTHWLFSEEGLREFITNAQDALKGGVK